MSNVFLKDELRRLEIDIDIMTKLNDVNIYTVGDLWNLTRIDLKKFKLTDNQINQIVIKMQLYGIDLNKRIYNKN